MSTQCRYFGSPQGCRWGETCRFSHSASNNQGSPSKSKSDAPSCRFYASGRCRYGASCYFKHDAKPPPSAESAENAEPKVVEDPPGADVADELTVSGFLRQLFAAKGVGPMNEEMHSALSRVCQSFYAVIIRWEDSPKWHSSNMAVVDSGRSVAKKSTGWGSAFLTETVREGLHHWRFKLQSLDSRRRYYVLFGIWKTQSGPPILDSFFTDRKHNGYALNVIDGTLTDPRLPGCGGIKYAAYCKAGDTVDMFLDLERLLLTFAINGKHYEKGQRVEEAEYKAAVTMYWEHDTIRFVAHDNLPFGGGE